VAAVTNRSAAEGVALVPQVDARGRTLPAIAAGSFPQEIAASADGHARRTAAGDEAGVGVHPHGEPAEPPSVPSHRVDPEGEARPMARRRAARARRDGARVAARLDRLAGEARAGRGVRTRTPGCGSRTSRWGGGIRRDGRPGQVRS